MSVAESEFERKMQKIAAEIAPHLLPRRRDETPLKEFKFAAEETSPGGMSGMAEVLAAHWSRSTHSDSEPMVDKCDGCGVVVYAWGDDPTPGGIEPLAAHQADMLTAAGFGPVKEVPSFTNHHSSVEAAAKVVVEEGAYGVPWGDASDSDREDALKKARHYLKAAAPHMPAEAKAEAWNEGFGAGWDEAKNPGAFVNDVWDASVTTDDEGRPVLVVGTGYPSFWHRPTNTYPGCTCPPWRYSPTHPKPTDPGCRRHGKPETAEN